MSAEKESDLDKIVKLSTLPAGSPVAVKSYVKRSSLGKLVIVRSGVRGAASTNGAVNSAPGSTPGSQSRSIAQESKAVTGVQTAISDAQASTEALKEARAEAAAQASGAKAAAAGNRIQKAAASRTSKALIAGAKSAAKVKTANVVAASKLSKSNAALQSSDVKSSVLGKIATNVASATSQASALKAQVQGVATVKSQIAKGAALKTNSAAPSSGTLGKNVVSPGINSSSTSVKSATAVPNPSKSVSSTTSNSSRTGTAAPPSSNTPKSTSSASITSAKSSTAPAKSSTAPAKSSTAPAKSSTAPAKSASKIAAAPKSTSSSPLSKLGSAGMPNLGFPNRSGRSFLTRSHPGVRALGRLLSGNNSRNSKSSDGRSAVRDSKTIVHVKNYNIRNDKDSGRENSKPERPSKNDLEYQAVKRAAILSAAASHLSSDEKAHIGLEAALAHRESHTFGFHSTPVGFHAKVEADAKRLVKASNEQSLTEDSIVQAGAIAHVQSALSAYGFPIQVNGEMNLETMFAILSYLKSVGIDL